MAFNITQYALFMVAGGFLMLFTTKSEQTKHYGSMLMGLGLLFYGMGVMSEAMGPLRSYQPFIDLMIKMQNPLFGILVGTVFTALIQSSAATTGIAIVLASEGLMSLEAGIALAFGANLGTCVSTFALVSLGKPREAIRAAMVHVLFNVAGVMIWFFFIPQLATFVEWISPSSPGLEGTAKMAAEVPRQIANAHTVFNVANTLIFIGFTSYFARVVEWMIPDKPLEEAKAIVVPKYLDEALVDTPSLAIERVRLELGHMGEIIEGMFAGLADAFDKWDPRKLEEVEKMDDQADILHEHILAYLGLIGRRELTKKEDQDLLNLMLATENLESIGDTIETDLVGLGNKMVAENLQPSDTVRQMLGTLYGHVSDGVASAVKAVSEEDERAAQEVFTLKADIDHQIDESQRYQAGRLVSREDNFLPLLRVEMDLLEKLKRIHTLSKRMARTVLPKELREVT
jgi:phosphate:Na+ symporter